MILISGSVCLLLGLALGWYFSSTIDLLYVNDHHARFLALTKQRDEVMRLLEVAIVDRSRSTERADALDKERGEFADALAAERRVR